MAQHDYVIDNSTGANVRADINNALLAISSNNSGSSAPSTTYALQTFANTTDSMLQLRNAANNAFVNLRKFDGSLPLPDGSVSSPSLFLDDDTNTGLFSSAADTLNFTTGGVEKLELGATTIFNEDGADIDFRIEGDANANLFYLDAGNDRIIIGHSSSRAVGGNTSRIFEIESTDASSGLSIIRNSANDSPAIISLGKSRSASNGGTTVVQNGDLLGQIQFAGADGTDLVTQGAAITATVDGTAGSNDMPCRLTFLTTADGGSSPTERFRIDSSGTVYVGGVGSGATAGTLFFNDTSANGSKIAQVNGSSALSFHTGSSQPEQMRIDSSGNLIIGATSYQNGGFGGSSHGINIAGTQPQILLHETDTDKDSYIGMSASTMFIGTADAIPMRFSTSDTERITVLANGLVGINDTSPTSYRLCVGGGIHATATSKFDGVITLNRYPHRGSD